MRPVGVLLIVLTVWLASCMTNNRLYQSYDRPILLYVDNEYHDEVHIWTAQEGHKIRHVGVAGAFGKSEFFINKNDIIAGALELLVVDLMDGSVISTDKVFLPDGVSVALSLGSQRNQQFLYPYLKQ